MVPKPLRSKERQERAQSCSAREEWNPATYFILIFLLIGSNAIHFVNLKRTYAISSRQADNKIALLREVIRKVQAGEEVNVEAALGTGDPLAEQEWHDVLKNVEEEDRLWRSKKEKKAKKDQGTDEEADANQSSAYSEKMVADVQDEELAPRPKRKPGFY